ncbi:hypothetical protein MMC11_008776, partial [Xylographa trunciseda]|nr:hypothetical protein [Xylographa trunciseda]
NSWSISTSRDLPVVGREEVLGHEDVEEPPRKKPRLSQRELFHEVFWPRDLLPIEFPQARILTWGYDVQVEQLLSPVSKASLFHHAESLLSDLAMLRNSTTDKSRPIFFIAHSLGGIVVKDALSLSRIEETIFSEILPATRGVIFLGTPHHGSKIASLGKIAFQLTEALGQKPNTQILRSLEINSETLERISRSFGQILATDQLKVHSFREELDTKGVKIVESFSSTIDYFKETRGTLHANHRNMAKCSSVHDVKFQRLASVLRRWIAELGETRTRNRAPARSDEDVSDLTDSRIFDAQYQTCLKSLNHVEARKRIKNVEPAYNTTYDWLLDDGMGFTDWLEGKNASTVYWIQGKPGSGKSTLMKYALTHPLTRKYLNMNSSGFWVIAAYFFHDRGTTVQKSVRGFLCEILYQALCQQQELFHLIYPIFARLDPAGSKEDSLENYSLGNLEEAWTIEDMQEALMLIAAKSMFEVNICLFVDALDEHDGNHRELISVLKQLAQSKGNPSFRLRLCLAGRPENVFRDAFQTCPGISIHEHTTQDIRLYVEEQIKDGMGSELTDRGVQDLNILVQDIIERAQGVFLWVRLVVTELIDGLCEGDGIEELKDVLSTIPTELEELYTRAIRRTRPSSMRIIAKHRLEAYIMFQVVLCARGPFDLHELLAATLYLTTQNEDCHALLERLSPDQMQRRLNSRSVGLLEAVGWGRGSQDIINVRHLPVQFMHQTVKEFMLTNTGRMAICEGLHDPPKESGFLSIYRYLLSLSKYFEPDTRDLFPHKTILNEYTYYAQKVDSETGRCAGQYLEPFISGQTQQRLRNTLIHMLDSDTERWLGERILNVGHSQRVQLVLFFIICDLPRSLREYVLLHMAELTDKDSSQIFNAFSHVSKLNSSLRPGFLCLNVLLETGLGAKLPFDAFISLDRCIQFGISGFGDIFELYSLSERTRQLWAKLRDEKTSSMQYLQQ